MTDTIEPVPDRIDQQKLAQQLVDAARAEGVELVGPAGLLSGLTNMVLTPYVLCMGDVQFTPTGPRVTPDVDSSPHSCTMRVPSHKPRRTRDRRQALRLPTTVTNQYPPTAAYPCWFGRPACRARTVTIANGPGACSSGFAQIKNPQLSAVCDVGVMGHVPHPPTLPPPVVVKVVTNRTDGLTSVPIHLTDPPTGAGD